MNDKDNKNLNHNQTDLEPTDHSQEVRAGGIGSDTATTTPGNSVKSDSIGSKVSSSTAKANNATNNTIFRDKSIERMSSPDKLDDYIRLSNPGIWFILTAVTLILVGAIIFGCVGHIDSVVPGVGISDGGKMTCLVKKEYGSRFTRDMTARIDDKTYDITLRSNAPVTVWDSTGAYALSVGNMQPGEWVYELDVDGTFTDGAYDVKIITEKISPLSFLFSDQ